MINKKEIEEKITEKLLYFINDVITIYFKDAEFWEGADVLFSSIKETILNIIIPGCSEQFANQSKQDKEMIISEMNILFLSKINEFYEDRRNKLKIVPIFIQESQTLH